jgi:glycine cleavage system transcriptional repressor
MLFAAAKSTCLRKASVTESAAKEWIIIMAAANRAGILAAVTKAMSELGGDLREASQTVVRGFFTMIFSAEFPGTMDAALIRGHLQDVCRPFGIELSVRDPAAQIPVHVAASTGTRQFRLRIGGRNEPGVLRSLSQIIARRGIDITGMHAVRTEEGGAFEMILRLALPNNFNDEQLLQEIEAVGRTLGVTADLKPAV